MYMEERKCCHCFSLRFGSSISCLIWAALSMYLAVLSFQNKSLFFSYFPQAPGVVFGVVNLILSLVSVAGLIILLINRRHNVKTLSHAIFVCVFLVLVDGFVNLILFITNKDDFNNWCISSSATSITNQFSSQQNGTNFNFSSDFYNCSHLWEDELKFGIVFYILIFAFYIYWAFSLYSYRHTYGLNGPEGLDYSPERMMEPPIHNFPINVPPAAMVNGPGGPGGPGGFGQGMPPPPPGDRSTIILTNQKPRSKSMIKKKKKTIDTFSLRNIKKPFSNNRTAPQEAVEEEPPYYENYATLGFEVSKDGELYEIENLDDCHSPAPTYRETERSAKKKTSKQKLRRYDDDINDHY